MDKCEEIEKRILEANDLDEMAEVLFDLLNGGFSVWTDESLYCIKQLVAIQKGLKIEIRPKEHPPPHFHVKSADLNASFTIEDCEMLSGDLEGRNVSLIKWWHKRSKKKLVEIWNATRPSDCPVGPITA